MRGFRPYVFITGTGMGHHSKKAERGAKKKSGPSHSHA